MTIQTQELARSFRYNSVDLPDPGIQYRPEEVRDFYAATYPEITTAAIEGPEEKDGKLVWTFRKAVGTKGNDGAGDGEPFPVRGSIARLRADRTTVPQLMNAAAQDPDPCSVFADGAGWHNASGAIIVVKGGAVAREIVEWLEARGFLTKPGSAALQAADGNKP
jgi:PRTRC genetic system protein C